MSCTITLTDEMKDPHGFGPPEAVHQIQPRST